MSAAAISSLSSAPPPVFAVTITAQMLMSYLIYAGAIVLVTVIVTLWITTLRQPSLKDSRRPHRHARSSRSGIWAWLSGGNDGESTNGKRGRRRRSHRRRNPTLAETGGLPPLRNQPPTSPENPQH